MFCVEQGVPEHEELDGRDHEGIHLVAVENGELLGTCRIADGRQHGPAQPAGGPRGRAPARDRHGAAATLADAETRAARGAPGRAARPDYARDLYEQAGYRARGRVFVEAGIEHIAMEKVL